MRRKSHMQVRTSATGAGDRSGREDVLTVVAVAVEASALVAVPREADG